MCDRKIYNLNREAPRKRITFEKRPDSGEGPAMQIFQGRALEAEGTAGAKA